MQLDFVHPACWGGSAELSCIAGGHVIRRKATGELSVLILSHMTGHTPIGIILDRLEEYPHELDADPETHRAILDWLRARHLTACNYLGNGS